MFTETITIGTPAVPYILRTSTSARSIRVPSGSTPINERRLEIAHEVTASKRVNSLVKVALVRPNPQSTTVVLEEGSLQLKIVRPGSLTLAEMKVLVDQLASFLANASNVDKLYNQEV